MTRFQNVQNFLDKIDVIAVGMVRFKTREGKIFFRRNVDREVEAAGNDRIAGVSTRLEHVRVDSSAGEEFRDSGWSCCCFASFIRAEILKFEFLIWNVIVRAKF